MVIEASVESDLAEFSRVERIIITSLSVVLVVLASVNFVGLHEVNRTIARRTWPPLIARDAT